MGKVIEFPGTGTGIGRSNSEHRIPEKKEEEEEIVDLVEEQDAHLDLNVLSKLFGFLTFLSTTDSRTNNRKNITERQKMMSEWTDSKLFTQLNHSDQSNWQKSPSIFHAMIAELYQRGFLPVKKSI